MTRTNWLFLSFVIVTVSAFAYLGDWASAFMFAMVGLLGLRANWKDGDP